MNSAPYWLLDRSYEVGEVKIVLAAGKVTRAMPWTKPQALTVMLSARLAGAVRRECMPVHHLAVRLRHLAVVLCLVPG